MRVSGVALCLMFSSACLFPQEDVFLDPEPEQRNRPPRIVEEQLQPTSRFLTVAPGDNCVLRFQFSVEDPDVEDEIEVEWWVDDSPPSNPELQNRQPLTKGRRVRAESAVYETAINNPASPFQNPGAYSVEALIADGRIFNRIVEQVPSPDGGQPEDFRYTDSISWHVNITIDPSTCVETNP